MSSVSKDAPLKILIEGLSNFERSQSGWIYKINESSPPIYVNKVHIQGEICKTAGFSNEILILDDGTGKAKVTRGSQVPGDLSWINAGMNCSIIGTVMNNGKLPHIIAIKIAKIDNKVLLEMWPWEVNELKDILTNRVAPKLPED